MHRNTNITNIQNTTDMEDKQGIIKLGIIQNLKPNTKGETCFNLLSKRVGKTIRQSDIDEYIESSRFEKEFIDEEGNIIKESDALAFRFKLPWNDKTTGQTLYGMFERRDLSSPFFGVKWFVLEYNRFSSYSGIVKPGSWYKLKELSGTKGISQYSIGKYIDGEIEYYNGAGYTKFEDGTPVDYEKGSFIKFSTNIKTITGDAIVGWFTKNRRKKYEGINWGTEKDFKAAQKEIRDIKGKCCVGRMVFESIESCNSFLEELKGKIIDETWEYKKKKDPYFKYPILKSYLEFELDRLYLEKDDEKFKYLDTIIYNKDRTKILYNTNLINSYGRDLYIVGNLLEISSKEYVENLEISPATRKLKEWGFDNIEPKTPQFFQDINEIVFHCDWYIDQDMSRYDHIIKDRIERFPEKYRGLSTDDLGQKLDHAIDFAKRIAQRNYKFIVPMYYPVEERIQLLMPIYMETSYSSHPDFALVLTPDTNLKIYTPETILGLDEVYQDARLIAKPEESWLNPKLID